MSKYGNRFMRLALNYTIWKFKNQHFSLSLFIFLNIFLYVNSLSKGTGGVCKIADKNSTSKNSTEHNSATLKELSILKVTRFLR